MEIYDFIVVGGGIAGVTCAEYIESQKYNTLILTSHPLLKTICNFMKLTKHIESFDVVEENYIEFKSKHHRIDIIIDSVLIFNHIQKTITTASNKTFKYLKSLCICTGSQPNIISPQIYLQNNLIDKNIFDKLSNSYIISLRDTSSVHELKIFLKHAKRVLIIGNGGIATELVYKIVDCQIIWVIKDESIAKKFLSPGASDYIISKYINQEEYEKSDNFYKNQYKKYSPTGDRTISQHEQIIPGSALGPNWHINLELKGSNIDCKCIHKPINVQIVYNTEIDSIYITSQKHEGFPLNVHLTNGQLYACDLIISATGVIPNSNTFKTEPTNLKLNPKDLNGILIDKHMMTNLADVYAAGDVCSIDPSNYSPNWFQMRLWDQAYHMGYLAAQNMTNPSNKLEPNQTNNFLIDHIDTDFKDDFYFELFTHTTRFFDQKVILLGHFNPILSDQYHDFKSHKSKVQQANQTGIEFMFRIESDQYIELVLSRSRESRLKFCEDETAILEAIDSKTDDISQAIGSINLNGPLYIRGAILIGETGLEETIENLILNGTDIAPFGQELLNPNIDIEDFFD
ncbi:unnamed protein product [Gordionus sp. m RMFG-2023]